MDCFVANAPRNDEGGDVIPLPIKANALISMDCRVKPGMTGNNGGTGIMRRKSAPLLAALLLAPLLTGCLERGQPTMVESGGDDDAFCRANNVAVGSPEYVACRKNRDVQRVNANARADRRQRDLGEYMLNNPNRP
jgi:hypothetical protein